MAMIFFIVLTALSPSLARARNMPSDDHQAQVNGKTSITTSHTASSATTSSSSSPRNVVQGLAEPSPPATEIDYRESNGYMPQGSVPSPGVGHHKIYLMVLK
ncbi:hypothetical protein EJB05_33050, partial [Eragrostis curvula]